MIGSENDQTEIEFIDVVLKYAYQTSLHGDDEEQLILCLFC